MLISIIRILKTYKKQEKQGDEQERPEAEQGRQEEEIPAIKCQDVSEIYLNLVNLGEDPDSLAWLQAPPTQACPPPLPLSTIHM